VAAAGDQIAVAQGFLRALGFDGERCNERSALVALALLRLGPGDAWIKAEAVTLRTVEIMEFLRKAYGKEYKPNTRETIRRRTLHQFVEAGFAVINPDEPARPVNSPNTCYQLQADVLRLARRIDTPRFRSALREYLAARPGLQVRYARARKQQMVPVVLPNGARVELTPGGQNMLIKQIVEEFCPRWTPAGRILYIGDAGKNDPIYDAEQLLRLGISLDKHGKLPDLVVHMQDRGWLVLLEAASTHGPIDSKTIRRAADAVWHGEGRPRVRELRAIARCASPIPFRDRVGDGSVVRGQSNPPDPLQR
jgi:hypothetical protein